MPVSYSDRAGHSYAVADESANTISALKSQIDDLTASLTLALRQSEEWNGRHQVATFEFNRLKDVLMRISSINMGPGRLVDDQYIAHLMQGMAREAIGFIGKEST